jgi:hypothetical protein
MRARYVLVVAGEQIGDDWDFADAQNEARLRLYHAPQGTEARIFRTSRGWPLVRVYVSEGDGRVRRADPVAERSPPRARAPSRRERQGELSAVERWAIEKRIGEALERLRRKT